MSVCPSKKIVRDRRGHRKGKQAARAAVRRQRQRQQRAWEGEVEV